MIDWDRVLADAVAAAQGVIGTHWQRVSRSASIQIRALVENARFIEESKDQMTTDEFEATKHNQKRALAGVLSGFAAISIVVAEKAAEAVWMVVASALATVPQLAPFV
jgi:hypothetical protein